MRQGGFKVVFQLSQHGIYPPCYQPGPAHSLTWAPGAIYSNSTRFSRHLLSRIARQKVYPLSKAGIELGAGRKGCAARQGGLPRGQGPRATTGSRFWGPNRASGHLRRPGKAQMSR